MTTTRTFKPHVYEAAVEKLRWNLDPRHDEKAELTPNQMRALLARLDGPTIEVDAELPRTYVNGRLIVCGIRTLGKPCWARGMDSAEACPSCYLILLLKGQ